jgi:hypothetical protein
LQPLLGPASVEEAVVERQDSIGIDVALAPTSRIYPRTDGLRVVALVVRVEYYKPGPLALPLYPVTSLKEVEPLVAYSKRVVL